MPETPSYPFAPRSANQHSQHPARGLVCLSFVAGGALLVVSSLGLACSSTSPSPPIGVSVGVSASPAALVPPQSAPSLEVLALPETTESPTPAPGISHALDATPAADSAPVTLDASPPVVVPLTTAPAAETTLSLPAPPIAPAAPLDPIERWRREGIIFLVEGQEWDAVSFTNVDKALSLLPASVRSRLGDRNLGPLTILVNRNGRTSFGAQPYGREANFFSTNEGRNELVLYPDQGVQTILHEMGHAYNLRGVPAGSYALVLLDSEMGSFMGATGWQVLTPPAQLTQVRDQTQVAYAYTGPTVWTHLSHDDPLEDYANSFALYYADPAALRQLSPARYDWFSASMPR